MSGAELDIFPEENDETDRSVNNGGNSEVYSKKLKTTENRFTEIFVYFFEKHGKKRSLSIAKNNIKVIKKDGLKNTTEILPQKRIGVNGRQVKTETENFQKK